MLCDFEVNGKVIDWWTSLNDEYKRRYGKHLVDIHPDFCSGRPRIKGTRFPVSQLLAELTEMSVEEFCEDFDQDLQNVKDALNFASVVLAYRHDKNMRDDVPC